jgi:T5SS/PEP-CTERM-associated repeat protein
LTSYLPKFSAGTLVVSLGSDGECALNVNGGSMSCVTVEAPAMNSSGTALVSVNGADTSFNVSGSFSLGLSGNGTLGIAGGAMMNSGDARLGGFSGFANATIDGPGTSWNVTGSLSVNGPAIGSSSSLTISNGARVAAGGFGIGRAGQLRIVSGGMLNSQNAGIENDSIDWPSKIVVDGDGSIWNIETFLRFGPSRGTAELDVTGGGTVIVVGNATVIAGSADDNRGTASILVDGPKSTFAIGQTLQLGGNSGGTLTVSNGANVSSGSALIYPKNFKIPGTALVTGAGSKWTTSGDFILDGMLTISDGGQVGVGGLMIIQDGGELHGDGTVTGNVQNGVLVAPGTSPGRLTIAGNYSQLSSGTLQIELAGINPGTSYDQLSVTGSTSVDGKLQISLLNSFAPKLGDSFDILDWGTLSGAFSSLQLPALGNDLAWDTSQLYTTGVISVTTVPEPAAAVLLGMAVPALLGVFFANSRTGNALRRMTKRASLVNSPNSGVR